MTERDTASEQEHEGRRVDDRRSEVKPTDNPVPSSPPPEEHAVREGEEKLDRV